MAGSKPISEQNKSMKLINFLNSTNKTPEKEGLK